MEDIITGWRPSPRRCYTDPTIFPNVEPLRPNTSHSPPMRRGPMYAAYAELREWNLRRKRAGLNSSTPTTTKRSLAPVCSRSVNDLSPLYLQENKKPMTPLPPATPKPGIVSTLPRPVSSNAELRRMRTTAVSSKQEDKRSGGLVAMKKSYSCLKELKEFPVVAASNIDEESKPRKGVHEGIFNKTVTRFRRQTTTWMS